MSLAPAVFPMLFEITSIPGLRQLPCRHKLSVAQEPNWIDHRYQLYQQAQS